MRAPTIPVSQHLGSEQWPLILYDFFCVMKSSMDNSSTWIKVYFIRRYEYRNGKVSHSDYVAQKAEIVTWLFYLYVNVQTSGVNLWKWLEGPRLANLANLPTPIFSPRISATLFWGTDEKNIKNK